jgi:hypothetical protein
VRVYNMSWGRVLSKPDELCAFQGGGNCSYPVDWQLTFKYDLEEGEPAPPLPYRLCEKHKEDFVNQHFGR